MAKKVIDTGGISSWTNHSSLVSSTGAVAGFTLSTSATQGNATATNTAGVRAAENVGGLYNTTVAMEGRMNPALVAANVGFSWGEYSTNVSGATITMNWENRPSTCVDATEALEFLPGLLTWSVAITAKYDDTDDLPLAKGAAGALSLTITDSADDTHIIGGNVLVQDVSTGRIAPGELPEVTITANGTGDLFAGDGYSTSTATAQMLDDLVDGSNRIANPGPSTLTMQGLTSRTYIVDAFLTSLSIPVIVDQVITWSGTAQGSGNLTGTAIS